MELDLALLYRLLDMEEDAPQRRLLRAAREDSVTLPHLALSLIEAEGTELGSGSGDELRRARVRADTYAELARRSGARVMKGPALARFYPDWALRPAGDLDLLLPDEAELWRTVHRLWSLVPVAEVGFSVLGEGHCVVMLSWPAEDPLLDRDYKIEFCTMPFAGDGAAVAVRTGLPEHEQTAQLLLLAEERFQRRYTVKDRIDLAVLTGQAPGDPEHLLTEADRLRLAPELAELLALDEPPPSWAPLLGALAGPSDTERQRRHDYRLPETNGVAERLRSGRPAYGLPLRAHHRPRLARSRIEHVDGNHLAHTPIGDFLLVDQALVSQDQYESALRALGSPA